MGEIAQRAARALWERFCHRRDDYAIQRPEGHYVRAGEPLSLERLEAHVAGGITIGAYQVRENTVSWVCLDVDSLHGDAAMAIDAVRGLRNTANSFGLRPLVEWSGRRGWHLWLLTETLSAETARAVGHGLVAETSEDALCTAHPIEVYPKQEQVNEAKPFGNLVKLPFGKRADNGQRGEFRHPETLAALSGLDQLALLEGAWIHPAAQLADLVRENGWKELPAAPLVAPPPAFPTAGSPTGHADDARIPAGTRNNSLTAYAGSLRRGGSTADEIAAALLVRNGKRCDPPLPEDEVLKIALSVARYAPHEATEWRVLAKDEAFASIEPLRKILTVPPHYVATVRGKSLELPLVDLVEYKRFKLACISQLDFVPLFPAGEGSDGKPLSMQATWERDFLEPALSRMTEVEPAPRDAGIPGAMWESVLAFLSARPASDKLDDVYHGRVVRTEDAFLFKGPALRSWLTANHQNDLKADQLYLVIRNHGGSEDRVHTQHGRVRVWRIPLTATREEA